MLYPVFGWVFGWLWQCTLTWSNWGWRGGAGVKISLSNLLNHFSVSGDSEQKQIFPQNKVVLWPQLGRGGGGLGTTQKYHFLKPPQTLSLEILHSLGFEQMTTSPSTPIRTIYLPPMVWIINTISTTPMRSTPNLRVWIDSTLPILQSSLPVQLFRVQSIPEKNA